MYRRVSAHATQRRGIHACGVRTLLKVGAIAAVDCAALQVLATSSLQDPSQVDWRTVLPTIVSNMHDYFISVAAKLEKTHSEVSTSHASRLLEHRRVCNAAAKTAIQHACIQLRR